MYKVLIVDDELLVRIGLKTTINWEHAGFIVVAEASGGEQGLELFKQFQPDVVFTDIKMARGNGIWLVEEIRKENKETHIIVLTCYDEFDYVRQVLKAGADDYILKSEVEDEELLKRMLEIREQLDEQNRHQKQDKKRTVSVGELKSALMSDLLKGHFVIDDRMQERGMDAEFEFGPSLFAFFSMAVELGKPSEHDGGHIQEAVLNIAANQLKEHKIPYLQTYQDGRYLFLIRFEEQDAEGLKRMLVMMGNALRQYFDVSASIVYSRGFGSMEAAMEVYKIFAVKEQVRFYGGIEPLQVVAADSVKFGGADALAMGKRYNNLLVEYLGQEKAVAVHELVEEIQKICTQDEMSPVTVRIFFSKLVEKVFAHYGAILEENSEIRRYNDYHQQIGQAPNLQSICQLMICLLDQARQTLRQSRHRNAKWIISKAVHYIEGHYDGKISLEDVAFELNLSKHYLCNVFKKETGENMSLYINKLRIKKAKQLLLQNGQIKEIYEVVGFSNQQYFSKVFKKITGMTISEYRDRGMNNKIES